MQAHQIQIFIWALSPDFPFLAGKLSQNRLIIEDGRHRKISEPLVFSYITNKGGATFGGRRPLKVCVRAPKARGLRKFLKIWNFLKNSFLKMQ